MLRTTSWAALVLAAVGTVPVAMHAGPFGLFGGSEAKQSAGDAVLQDVAKALRAAKIQGRDVEIEYDQGTLTLVGFVADASNKARATQACSHVPGVENVVNQMRISGPATAAAARTRPATPSAPRGGIVQASNEEFAPAVDAFDTATFETPAASSNQQVAQKIATALSGQNLQGYDIRIHYQNGVATLGGSIASREQWAQASQAAGTVPEVRQVVNRMQVGRPQPNVRQVGYRQDPPMPMPGAAPMPGGAPMGPPPGWSPPAAPQPYGHPGAGMANQAYSMPNLPDHAWPAQAQYPNSAQISYPQMYSASAWPYIGPFYPYPQVPLGWREAQLEWDDGFWHLNFKPRTSKWFWFVNPRNW